MISPISRFLLLMAISAIAFLVLPLIDQVLLEVSSERTTTLNSNNLRRSNCTLLKEGKGPSPVILMALGRSGSSATWTTMSNLTGHTSVAYERTGGNDEKSNAFFASLEANPYEGHDWAIKHLCRVQQKRKDVPLHAGIVGFQWKPYTKSFNHEYSIEGLRAIAAQRDPTVRVVYLTRNALDRRISNIRHKQSGKSISAHCAVGDEECIHQHSKFDVNITLPTGNELKNWLTHTYKEENNVRKRLDELNVQYVEVSYDKLYNSDDADEWMRIFRFLKVGPLKNLTIDEVRASFSMASTSTKSRAENIVNYAEVERTLRGTEFYHLLR